ncbi:hypothetical protein [Rhizobium sp. FY34]|nr:hypothetical protein [Rhizobium sp. FY34]
MANLILDGKAKYLFDRADPQRFSDEILPGLLERAWPYGKG